jgi:putative tryptophan/tyrosine transport system substrate-binding protein
MDRRTFIGAVAASLAAAPLMALAQPRRKVWRIGYLTPVGQAASTALLAPLSDALRELGYVDGQTVRFEVRAAEGDLDRLPPMADELVDAKVDIIVAVSPPAILAANRATKTIPIVMAFWGGPGLIESGTIASFARPGTNVTGVYMLAAELEAKRLELLLQGLPNARRIAVLNPGPGGGVDRLVELRPVAQAAKVELHMTQISGSKDYGSVFETISADRVDAVLVPSSPRFYLERSQIIEAAARQRIPAMYEWGDMARAGGLMAYGPVFVELHRRIALYVNHILKGAKPADLPVEQPTKFELVINLKTAKTLGLTIPQPLLLRADEISE